MEPRWKYLFTAPIAGPTFSGKMYFVRKFLQHLPDMVEPVPEEIIWCYGKWQILYQALQGVHFMEGLPDVEQWKGDKKRLVVIDDLMADTDKQVTKLLTKGSHHRDLSVMYIVMCKTYSGNTRNSELLV
jgi:hypothetical protein